MGNTGGGGYLQYNEAKLIDNSRMIEVELCNQIAKELFFDYCGFFMEKEFNKLLMKYDKDLINLGADTCFHYINGRKYIMFKTFVGLIKEATFNVYKNFDNCQKSLLGVEIEKLKQKIKELKNENKKIIDELPIYLKT